MTLEGSKVKEARFKMPDNDWALTYWLDLLLTPPPKPADVPSNMEWSQILANIIKEELDLYGGPNVVIEATGAASCIETGIHLTKKGVTCAQAGIGERACPFLSTIQPRYSLVSTQTP
jgi:D-xylulose reductase